MIFINTVSYPIAAHIMPVSLIKVHTGFRMTLNRVMVIILRHFTQSESYVKLIVARLTVFATEM